MNETVLWSGGYDSTLVLHDMLQKEIPVSALTVTHPQLPSLNQEKDARDRLKNKMKKFDHTEKLANVEGSWSLPIWINEMIPFIKDKTTLYLATHKGDNFQSKGDYNYLVETFNEITKKRGKDITISIPLMKLTKTQIIQKLLETDLFEDCWTCTTPQGLFQCGECKECKSLNIVLEEIKK